MSIKFVTPPQQFVENYEPTTHLGRTAEPNEYTDSVNGLLLSWDAAAKRTKGAFKLFVHPDQTRGSVTSKWGRAANAAGYTPRFEDKANETHEVVINDETGETAKISFGVVMTYLVPLITRPRKSKTITITHVGDNDAPKVSLVKVAA